MLDKTITIEATPTTLSKKEIMASVNDVFKNVKMIRKVSETFRAEVDSFLSDAVPGSEDKKPDQIEKYQLNPHDLLTMLKDYGQNYESEIETAVKKAWNQLKISILRKIAETMRIKSIYPQIQTLKRSNGKEFYQLNSQNIFPQAKLIYELLLTQPGRVFTFDEILASIWPQTEDSDPDEVVNSKNIAVHVCSLKKFFTNSPVQIQNVSGIGYVLHQEESELYRANKKILLLKNPLVEYVPALKKFFKNRKMDEATIQSGHDVLVQLISHPKQILKTSAEDKSLSPQICYIRKTLSGIYPDLGSCIKNEWKVGFKWNPDAIPTHNNAD